MQAKKCDRCGRLYELYNAASNRKKCNGFRLINIDGNQNVYLHDAYDMCSECMEDFMKWLYAIKNGMDK